MSTHRVSSLAFALLLLFCTNASAQVRQRITFGEPQYAKSSIQRSTSGEIEHFVKKKIAPQQAPMAILEQLSYFDEAMDVATMMPLPMPFTTFNGDGSVYAYFERFTSALTDPVLDSISIVLATEDVDLSGQVRVDIIKTLTSNGLFFADESVPPIASYFVDADRLLRGELAEITLDCGELRLGQKNFMIAIKQHTLNAQLYVVFDDKAEDEHRDVNDAIDRAYFSYVDSADEAYNAFLGGSFMNEDQLILYPNMIAFAYLHEYGTETIDTEWKHSITGNGEERLNSLVRTSDGGFLVVGSTGSQAGDAGATFGSGDYLVGKYDRSGKRQWLKHYGGSSTDYAMHAAEFSGERYIIAGGSASRDGEVGPHPGGGAAWIVTLDKNGNILKSKAYGSFGSGIDGYSIARDTTGGIETAIVMGLADETTLPQLPGSYKTGQGTAWLAKLTMDGDTVWTRSFGRTGMMPPPNPHAMAVLPNGSIAVSLITIGPDPVTIHCFDRNGNQVDTLALGSNPNGYLSTHGSDLFSTVVGDSLLYIRQDGSIAETHRIKGLQDAAMIERGFDNSTLILGKSRSVGDSLESSLFFVDDEGVVTNIAKTGITSTFSFAILPDSNGYLFGEQIATNQGDINIQRVSEVPSPAPAATAVSLIETCRASALDIPVTVKSGIYPIVASFTEGFGTPIVSDMVLRGPADGDEFVLHYVAWQNTLINVRITDASGASTQLPINVTIGIEAKPTVIVEGATLKSSVEAETYQWIDASGGDIPLASNRTFAPTMNGQYAVRITANECTETSEFFTFSGSSVDRVNSIAPIISYSNASHLLTLDVQPGDWQLSIFNSIGQQVRSHALMNSRSSIDLSELPRGVYIVNLASEGKAYSKIINR